MIVVRLNAVLSDFHAARRHTDILQMKLIKKIIIIIIKASLSGPLGDTREEAGDGAGLPGLPLTRYR